MKPFDLERALKGDELITRNKSKAINFRFLTKKEKGDCYIFIFSATIKEYNEEKTYDYTGHYHELIRDHHLDLFMFEEGVDTYKYY